MDKKIEETLRQFVVQTLNAPIFTASTLYAGLVVWGWSNCMDLLVHQGDNEQLVRLIRKATYQNLLTKLPAIEVDEETYHRWMANKQVVSYIGEDRV